MYEIFVFKLKSNLFS